MEASTNAETVAWRTPFGDSGILSFFLGVIATDPLRPALQLHTLRLIGNSCADTDENRARVVDGNHLLPIIRRLQDETLIPFTVPVLYNILVDYGQLPVSLVSSDADNHIEPAQLNASQANLNQYLTAIFSSPNISNYAPFVTYICKTLVLLNTQEGEAALANPLTVHLLLNLAQGSTNDVEDFVSLATAASAYLTSEIFQKGMITGAELPLFLNTIYQAHTVFSLDHIDDEDEATSLKETRESLQKALADVTAHDEFPTYHPLGTPVPQKLLSWLHAPDEALRSAACLALGNLSRSDETSTALVHTYGAHTPLIKLITDPATSDPKVLHSALSFLKNLAIPAQNKPALGDLLNPSCVPRIFSLDTLPQVQFAAVSLTRLLLINCPDNVERVCRHLSTDKWSPSHERTTVSGLCSIFDRTDAEPTKVEAARAILTICRVLHSNSVKPILVDWDPENPEDIDDDCQRRHLFYSKTHLGDALSFLVTQQKWPVLRSEAWFVFALMCRSKDGGGVIISVTLSDIATAALVQAVTGRPTSPSTVAQLGETPPSTMSSPTGSSNSMALGLEPQQVDPMQQADMARVDRENAIVMCQEILRNWADELPQMRLSMWQGLIKEGTHMIAAERGQTI